MVGCFCNYYYTMDKTNIHNNTTQTIHTTFNSNFSVHLIITQTIINSVMLYLPHAYYYNTHINSSQLFDPNSKYGWNGKISRV